MQILEQSCPKFKTYRSTRIIHGRSLQNHIFMRSNDPEFLKEKGLTIAKYTQKIDPNVEIGVVNVQKCSLSIQKATSFKYQITLHDILPRVVTAFYRSREKWWGCCRRAAAISAGIVPGPIPGMIISDGSSKDLALAVAVTERVTTGELASGDLLFFNNHSFVYLDSQICLSKNGRGGVFEIQTIEAVRREYFPSFEKDFLVNRQSLFRKHMTVWRKQEDFVYPETITQGILKLCSVWHLNLYKSTKHLHEPLNREAVNHLRKVIYAQISDPKISKDLKVSMALIFNYFVVKNDHHSFDGLAKSIRVKING